MAANLNYGTYYSGQTNQPLGNMRKILVIGIIAAVLIAAGLFAFTPLSSSNKNDVTLLAVRENSLLQLATTSQKNIKNPDLSTANSNTTILLTSDVANIVKVTGSKKLPDNLVKQEADTHGDQLNQANLLDTFDVAYRQVVLDKVSALITQAQTVKAATTNKKLRTAVDQALVSLQSINQQFTQLKL